MVSAGVYSKYQIHYPGDRSPIMGFIREGFAVFPAARRYAYRKPAKATLQPLLERLLISRGSVTRGPEPILG